MLTATLLGSLGWAGLGWADNFQQKLKSLQTRAGLIFLKQFLLCELKVSFRCEIQYFLQPSVQCTPSNGILWEWDPCWTFKDLWV